MKKILLFASAVAMMLSVGSCQREIEYLEGDTNVTFEVSTGDIATRAIADASNITVLHWELYGSDIRTAKAPYGEGTVTETDGDKKFTVNLRLVADQDYNIVFWAETEHGATHYETSDLRNVKIKTYADENANDESRAAFFAVHSFQTENGVSVNEQVTLYRPFAQINLGTTTYTTDLNLVNGGKVAVNSTEMTVTSIANVFNTLDGVGVAENFDGKVTFKAAATPNGEADKTQKLLTVNEEGYYWIGMNYLIVVGDTDAIDVDVVLNTNMGVVEHSIANVPIKENYRTNILGDFLTTGATFNIVVDERFEVPDYIVNPYPPVNEKLYSVQTVDELLKYAYMVNYVDKTLELELLNDITLPQYEIAADDARQTYVYTTTPVTVSAGVPSGNNWMPLGTASVMFEGKIEGNGNTIKGLRIKSDDELLGFVAAAMTAGTSIKNLNFEDAVVAGTSLVGTVAGYVRDGVQISNCHVRNVSVNGTSDNVGALVGQHYTRYNTVPGIEGGKLPKTVMENCTADEASTVKGRDNVGGIVGINYGGVMINCRNAATVEGDGNVGGIVGYTREYHHYKSGYVIACGNEGKVSGNSTVGSIVGNSLKDNNHTESVSAVVACWSTAEEGSYPYLLVANCVNAVNYGSWGIKTQPSQSAIRNGQNTACYAFDSADSITQAQVDAMNAAIDTFNAGKTSADAEYCPYKWSWTAGSLPVLK